VNRRQIASLLPEVLRRTDQPGSPMRALLETAASLLAPVATELDRVHANFSARDARDRFVAMLARWLDLDRLLAEAPRPDAATGTGLPTGTGRLRELVAAAAHLAEWAGSKRGLLETLQTATGLGDWVVEDNPDGEAGPRPFYFRVTAPAASRPYETLVRRILEQEKPAYAQCELRFAAAPERDS